MNTSISIETIKTVIDGLRPEINDFLEPAGLTISIDNGYDFNRKATKHWLACYEEGSVFSKSIEIAINYSSYVQQAIKNKLTSESLADDIEVCIWHEVGHGLVEYIVDLYKEGLLNDILNNDKTEDLRQFLSFVRQDEEEIVEDFGRAQLWGYWSLLASAYKQCTGAVCETKYKYGNILEAAVKGDALMLNEASIGYEFFNDAEEVYRNYKIKGMQVPFLNTTYTLPNKRDLHVNSTAYILYHFCQSISKSVRFTFIEYDIPRKLTPYIIQDISLAGSTKIDNMVFNITIPYCTWYSKGEIISTIVHELVHVKQFKESGDASIPDWYGTSLRHNQQSNVDVLVYLLNKREMDALTQDLISRIDAEGYKTMDDIEKTDIYHVIVTKRHEIFNDIVNPNNKQDVERQLKDYNVSYNKFITYITDKMRQFDKQIASSLRHYFSMYVNERVVRNADSWH